MLIRVLFFICLIAGTASAQSKSIGRLSDGRAFRIDESGMRLIDQVAELEVSNDDLKRQVISLEDELKEKKGIIESLRAGINVAPEDKLKEQDLLGNTSSGLPKAATAVCDKTELEQLKAKLAQSNQSQSTDSQKYEMLESKFKQLEEENIRNKDRIALLSAEKSQLLAQLESSKTPDSERNQLVQRLSKLEQEKEKLYEDNNNLKNLLASKEQDLSVKDRALIDNKRLLEQENIASKDKQMEENRRLQQELADLKEQLIETQREASKLQENESRSRMAEVEKVQAVPVRLEQSPEAKNLLVAIQSKIMKRKSLLDNVSRSKKGISISASNLVTSNGVSLDRLRHAVNSGGTDPVVIKGLHEISGILDGDISTAARLAH